MDLFRAVQTLNFTEVKKLLEGSNPCNLNDNYGRSLLHIVVDIYLYDDQSNEIQSFAAKRDIIYMLIDAGIDCELLDNDGKSCLCYAMENDDPEICEILLQCGADLFSVSQNGNSIVEEIFANETAVTEKSSTKMQDVFKKYYPGLWQAVSLRDIGQVRRLTNLWCKTDLTKDGKSLKELALDGGHEEIISLVFGIHDTMKLIYHMLSKNIEAVSVMLEKSKKNLRLDLRKMSERGAPILYYLIQRNDSAMIELFVNHGCHVYTIMRDNFGYDMPVLFSALHQSVPVDVIESLLPKNKLQQEEMMYKLLYKGLTILEVALQNRVSLEVFNAIIDRGGPLLIMDRNQFNQSVREVAYMSDLNDYVGIIDKNVLNWIASPEMYPKRREALALMGFNHMTVSEFHDDRNRNEKNAMKFLEQLSNYQHLIGDLAMAIHTGNTEEFEKLKNSSHEFDMFEQQLTWDGRIKGDGLPLLHRAVLFNCPGIVKMILDDKPEFQSVDTLLDQNHRTAVHYAYANPCAIEIRQLLLDSGCSEHVLDRQNREPLDFRDKKDSPSMHELLNRLMFEEIHLPEPNPWDETENNLNLNDNNCTKDHYHDCCHNSNYIFDEKNDAWNDTDSETEIDAKRYCIIV